MGSPGTEGPPVYFSGNGGREREQQQDRAKNRREDRKDRERRKRTRTAFEGGFGLLLQWPNFCKSDHPNPLQTAGVEIEAEKKATIQVSTDHPDHLQTVGGQTKINDLLLQLQMAH
ncbi:hypothetical protein AAC387_Pa03g2472 [Persea americana]